MILDCLEAFYGGAAGGGKSEALLMAALQYVEVPNYSAILFRKSYADLSRSGALMDRAFEWLNDKAHWKGQEKRWEFPSGATLSFGYLDTANDKYRYQGSEFQFVGFDETTQINEDDYRYLFSRLRKKVGLDVPLRVRSASNPGGAGHEWVKDRFITNPGKRKFIPATINDNPHLNADEYRQSLQNLDHITRRQLEDGNWDVLPDGDIFLRDWIRYAEETNGFFKYEGGACEIRDCWRFGTVDLATSEKAAADYTVLCSWAVTPDNHMILLDVYRDHIEAPKAVKRIKALCSRHDLDWVGVEGVGYQLSMIQHLRAEGLAVRKLDAKGDKVSRAQSASLRFEAGKVHFLKGPWLAALESELLAFPKGSHDDQTDAIAYGCNAVSRLCRDELIPKAREQIKEDEPEELTEEEAFTAREYAFMFGDDDDG